MLTFEYKNKPKAMTHTQLIRNEKHTEGRSYDMTVIAFSDQVKKTKVKMTYITYNGHGESFQVEFLDGLTWSPAFNLYDLGLNQVLCAYSRMTNDERKKRADQLIKQAIELVKITLD